MPLLSPKENLGELYDTYLVIKKISLPVSKKILQWYESALPENVELICHNMNLGKSIIPFGNQLTSEEIKYKRALILLRSSLLWQNPNEVLHEVDAMRPFALKRQLNICIIACESIENECPPSILYLATRASTESSLKTRESFKSKNILEKNQIIQERLQAEIAGLKARASEIFCPYRDEEDTSLEGVIQYLQNEFSDTQSIKTMDTLPSFSKLDEGGDLYIVGHSNFGTSIGSHCQHLNEKQLVEVLEKAGLSKSRNMPINIFLFAC